MSEQPTIGKIEQLTTNTDPRSPLDVLNKIKGVVNAPPDWSSKHDGEVWQELDRLRAENARLREALEAYANHDNWIERSTRYIPTDSSMVSDIWDGGLDVNGWETAERALADDNKKDTP